MHMFGISFLYLPGKGTRTIIFTALNDKQGEASCRSFEHLLVDRVVEFSSARADCPKSRKTVLSRSVTL